MQHPRSLSIVALLIMTVLPFSVGWAAEGEVPAEGSEIATLLDEADELAVKLQACNALRNLERFEDSLALENLDLEIQMAIADRNVTKSYQEAYEEYFANREYKHQSCIETTRERGSTLIASLKAHVRTENQRAALKELYSQFAATADAVTGGNFEEEKSKLTKSASGLRFEFE